MPAGLAAQTSERNAMIDTTHNGDTMALRYGDIHDLADELSNLASD